MKKTKSNEDLYKEFVKAWEVSGNPQDHPVCTYCMFHLISNQKYPCNICVANRGDQNNFLHKHFTKLENKRTKK